MHLVLYTLFHPLFFTLLPSPLQHPPASQSLLTNLVVSNHQLGGDAYTNDKEWHLIVTFSQPTSVWWPGLYSLLASSEPRRVAVILSGCPPPTAHWKDGTSYPSNYTPFLLSWKDISLNFEVDSKTWKYRLSEIVKVLRDGLIQLFHFMEEETEVQRGEMAYSMLQKEWWQSWDKNRWERKWGTIGICNVELHILIILSMKKPFSCCILF